MLFITFLSLVLGLSTFVLEKQGPNKLLLIVTRLMKLHGERLNKKDLNIFAMSSMLMQKHHGFSRFFLLDYLDIFLIFIVFIGAFYVRIFLIGDFPLGTDNVNQYEFVTNVIRFIGFPSKRAFMSPGSTFIYPPIGIIIQIIFQIILCQSIKPVFVAHWLSLITSSLSVVFIYLISKSLFNRVAALFASFTALISYPELILLCWSGFPSVFGMLLFTLYLYFLISYIQKDCFIYFFLLSLTLSIAILTHLYSALIIALITGFIFFIYNKRRILLQLALLVFLMTAPWSIYHFLLILPSLYKLLFTPSTFQRVTFRSSFNLSDFFGGAYLYLFSIPALIQMFYVPKDKQGVIKVILVCFAIPFLTGILGWNLEWLGSRFLSYRPLYYALTPLSILSGEGFSSLINLCKSCEKGKKIYLSLIVFKKWKANIKIFSLFVEILLISAVFSVSIFTSKVNFSKVLTIRRYYEFVNQEDLETLEWISRNLNGTVVSDWYFGQWIAGYANIPTIPALPANVYFTNQVEYEQGKIADAILSKKPGWLSLARQNGIKYIVVNTRLNYIDGFTPLSPTYPYYNIAGFCNNAENASFALIRYKWASTPGTTVKVENESIIFGTSYSGKDRWYAFQIFPSNDKYKYLFLNISLLTPLVHQIIDPKIILYYDDKTENYTAYLIPIDYNFSSNKFLLSIPEDKHLKEIRFAFYSIDEGASWFMKINNIELAKSLNDLFNSNNLKLIYHEHNTFVLEIANSQQPTSIYGGLIYPLWIYLPLQCAMFPLTFFVSKRLFAEKQI